MLGFLSEISTHQTDLIKSLALFYLIIFSNFMLQLFTCYQQNIIIKNKVIQYIIGFFLFYFLVILVSNTANLVYIPPIQKFIYSIGYYLIFVITTRLNMKIMLTVLFLIFIIYFIELNKDYYLKIGKTIHEKDVINKQFYEEHNYWITIDFPVKVRLFPVEKSQFIFLNKIEEIIYTLIVVSIFAGFIAYGGELKDKFKKNKKISWEDVFEDTSVCKISEKKSFMYYFKQGLGLKL